jgi:hypothetical protein
MGCKKLFSYFVDSVAPWFYGKIGTYPLLCTCKDIPPATIGRFIGPGEFLLLFTEIGNYQNFVAVLFPFKSIDNSIITGLKLPE